MSFRTELKEHPVTLLIALAGVIVALLPHVVSLVDGWLEDELSVTIDTPAANAHVDRVITVSGHAKNVPSDRDLWLILRPASDGRFYPKNLGDGDGGPLATDQDGAWTVPGVDIGANDTPRGEIFTLLVYLATSKQSEDLRQLLQPGSVGFREGLVALDPTLNTVAEIKVRAAGP